MLIQYGNYELMIYKPDQIINYLKENEISICENYLLMTGTSKGIMSPEKDTDFRMIFIPRC